MKISNFVPEVMKTFRGDRNVVVEVWERNTHGGVVKKTGYEIGHIRTAIHEDKVVIVCEHSESETVDNER